MHGHVNTEGLPGLKLMNQFTCRYHRRRHGTHLAVELHGIKSSRLFWGVVVVAMHELFQLFVLFTGDIQTLHVQKQKIRYALCLCFSYT